MPPSLEGQVQRFCVNGIPPLPYVKSEICCLLYLMFPIFSLSLKKKCFRWESKPCWWGGGMSFTFLMLLKMIGIITSVLDE